MSERLSIQEEIERGWVSTEDYKKKRPIKEWLAEIKRQDRIVHDLSLMVGRS